MSVHQPVHYGVHQPHGEALPGGHPFIKSGDNMNEGPLAQPVHYLKNTTSGHPGGQVKSFIANALASLSTIFLFKSKKEEERERGRSGALIRARGGHGGHDITALWDQPPTYGADPHA